MKIFHVAAKLDAGADKKHDINFHWPNIYIHHKIAMNHGYIFPIKLRLPGII